MASFHGKALGVDIQESPRASASLHPRPRQVLGDVSHASLGTELEGKKFVAWLISPSSDSVAAGHSKCGSIESGGASGPVRTPKELSLCVCVCVCVALSSVSLSLSLLQRL